MGRKSKLTEAQWLEIEKRMLAEEPVRALAREFGVSETAIRARKSSHVTEIKAVANQIVKAEVALRALPITSQRTAETLAQKLLALSDNLLGAASNGAATSHRLNAIANGLVQRVDDANPLESMDTLKAVAIIGKIANDSAAIGLNLLNANKGMIGSEPPERPSALPEGVEDAALAYAKYMG